MNKKYNYYDINHISFFNVNENFENEYNSWNKVDRKGYFVLGETSSSLINIGLFHQNIVIDKSKLLKIKNKHLGMSDFVIKQIPNILKYPILILKSESIKDRIVVFGNVFDINNKPVMVAMELNPDENKRNIDKIYKIASAYGKENLKSLNMWLSHRDNILFLDNKKRTINWLNGLGLELPLPFVNSSIKKSVMIKDIPISERPRERAIKYGIDNLSNEDLISIIIKTGTKDISVKNLSNEILSLTKNINDLKDLTLQTLTSINGIGSVKAIELLSAIELGKRVFYKKDKVNIKLNNSKVIYEYFKDLVIDEKQENFYAIYLDTKSNLITYKLLFKGTINTSCVHPREVFKYAVLNSAYSVIVFHNHPSGDIAPSPEDNEVTNSLFKIGKLMAIPVIDHLIFGRDKYFSFYEYLNNKNNII
jgi:DNA repair protein RadC